MLAIFLILVVAIGLCWLVDKNKFMAYCNSFYEKHPGLAIVLGLFVLFGVIVIGLHVFAILASIVITMLVILAVFMFLAGMISFKK